MFIFCAYLLTIFGTQTPSQHNSVEQMPTVSRSDCTEIVLTETIKITYDSFTNVFEGKIIDIDIDFNACKGINNRNNDLWAYMARLYYEGEVTKEQFGELGRIITDNGCEEAVEYQLSQQGLTTGYVHDENTWTFVAGRDDMEIHDGYGNKAFKRAMDAASSSAPNGIVYRICPGCESTHKKIYYRRLTAIPDNFDLLDNILYHGDNGGGNNVWNEDFSIHSTYEDALAGANPWKCPGNSYNYGSGFPGNCSPSGAQVKNQQSRFNQSNEQKNVAYYVNKAEYSQLQVAPTTVIGDSNAGGVAVLDDEGTIYLTGTGNDIWWNYDDFNYYSQAAVGDQTVTVNLSSQSHIWFDEWSKAGIMFRVTDEPDSPHVSVVLTGNRGICTYSRSGAYGGNPDDKRTVSHGCKSTGATSAWLKLEKRIDTITSYLGTADENGNVSWSKMHSVNAPFIGDEFSVGLAACSKRPYEMEAVFEKYSVESYFFPSAAPSVSAAPTAYGKSKTRDV
jgi:regulation of enolase protein 1 (concanavalin A-like superfamily)